jgi:hypothetical protein
VTRSRHAARAAGFDEHLTKPVDPEALEHLAGRAHFRLVIMQAPQRHERWVAQARVVLDALADGGEVLARTTSKGGLAVAEIDVEAEIARSRRVLHHLKELTPTAYRLPGRPE